MPYKSIKRIFEANSAKSASSKSSDFSAFTSVVPSSRKMLLLEECKNKNISIYINDPLEQAAGAYEILRGIVSESELECRLNAKRTTTLSKHSNVILFFSLIVSTIALVTSLL